MNFFIFLDIERVRGVEPLSSAWKAEVIPIYDTRNTKFCCRRAGIRTRNKSSQRTCAAVTLLSVYALLNIAKFSLVVNYGIMVQYINMFKKIGAQLDIIGQCKRYGLSLWQCPQFLFIVMGLFIILVSIVSYLIGAHYIVSSEIVIFVVLTVTSILFIISFIITRSFERLAEASRMKSEFINIISHQLRSPLTNIKWTFEVMASEEFKVPAEKQEEYFVNVKENIARMVELIDDLLIVSKIEQGSFSMTKREISLEGLIKDLVERYKVFAEASRIKLNFYSQENLPKVLADPSFLKIVTENLIDNAIRYTKGGGIVEIKLIKEKGKVLFAIKDSGVGIPQEEQKYIFQKFFRAENISKERTRGSGLGLYVCKSILDKLGGQIWFKSQLGKGTTFYFRLPIK